MFWRNYFYRVSLIKQYGMLNAMEQEISNRSDKEKLKLPTESEVVENELGNGSAAVSETVAPKTETTTTDEPVTTKLDDDKWLKEMTETLESTTNAPTAKNENAPPVNPVTAEPEDWEAELQKELDMY